MTTGGRQGGNLPEETTSMVGRGHELARVRTLCAESRLVTLTGSGGVGKTRLAVRAAADLRPRFADGAWLVELSPLDQGPLLAHTIAEALPLADQTSRPMVDVLADYLADRDLLLVLDTCEHLVDPCALLIQALLAVAPGLHILTTSRRPLGLLAEQVLTVEPLPVPDEAGGGPQDAVALLADRAARVVPGFAVTAGNRAAVLRVCRRLEGLPLAIELAAARLHDLPLEQLAERLEDRFALLGDAGDDAGGAGEDEGHGADPPRHRALRTAVGWSHELCTSAQRLAWARLSVFAGAFDVETARQVCADERLPADQLPALLDALVDASILTWLPTGGGERYRMLDTIREYGMCWLRDLGEHAELRRRHRDHYLELARRGDAAWLGPDQYKWYDWIAAEHDNLRAALEFSLTEADGHTAVELAGALWFVWDGCGLPKEGRHYLERALALTAGRPSPSRTKALLALGLVTLSQGDPDTAATLAEEYIREGERHGEAHALATGLGLTMCAHVMRGDLRGAMALSTPLLDRTAGDGPTLAHFMIRLVAGLTYILAGRCEEAVAVLEQMRRSCDRHGERWMRSYGDAIRAQAELALGYPRAAQVYARAALEVKHRMNDRVGIAIALDTLGPATLAAGHSRYAAYLLGLAQQVWDTVGRAQAGVPSWVATRQACEKQARAALGDEAYRAAYRSGYLADLATGIAHAVDPAHCGRGRTKQAKWGDGCPGDDPECLGDR